MTAPQKAKSKSIYVYYEKETVTTSQFLGIGGGKKEEEKDERKEKIFNEIEPVRIESDNTHQVKRRSNMRVNHFEINADDPERAAQFYREVFGWQIKKWEGPIDYWLVTTGPDDKPGINGGLMKRESPQETTVNSIEVPSVDELTKKIVEKGGKVVVPKMAIPGVGYMAYCQDTEGNTFGIMEPDETAQ